MLPTGSVSGRFSAAGYGFGTGASAASDMFKLTKDNWDEVHLRARSVALCSLTRCIPELLEDGDV